MRVYHGPRNQEDWLSQGDERADGGKGAREGGGGHAAARVGEEGALPLSGGAQGRARGAREAAKEEVGAKAGPAGGDLAADNKMKIPVG